MSSTMEWGEAKAPNLALPQCLSLVVMGMYTWEILTSLSFDLSLLSGRRQFRWPFVSYLICRYSFLGALITFQIFSYARTELNCKALYITSGILGNFTIGMASTNLAIRTFAIWMRKRLVLVLLAIFGIGQWTVIVRDIALRDALWDDSGRMCDVRPVKIAELAILYFPTMLFDLLVLILSTIGLLRQGPLRSPLQVLVFKQGLIYFLLTFSANFFPAVFALVDLGFLGIDLVLTFTFIASFVSSVASCRLVRDLVKYAEQDEARHGDHGIQVERNAEVSLNNLYDKQSTNAAQFTTNIDLISTVQNKQYSQALALRDVHDQTLTGQQSWDRVTASNSEIV